MHGSDWGAAPRILLITDRVPGYDSGYGIRVSNVIDGLSAAGNLHVCLVDSSSRGESLPADKSYTTSVVRAENPSAGHKLLLALKAPAGLPYRRQDRVREDLVAQVGHRPWDLVWCSRVRTHQLTSGVLPGRRVVDFDDLNDCLVRSEIEDRTGRYGRVRSAPHNAMGWLDAKRWSEIQREIARQVDRVVVCSEVDRARLAIVNGEVVPNGYPRPGCVQRLPRSGPPTLLFVGPLSYEPNRLAVDWLAFEMLPILRRTVPDVRLVVIGDRTGVSDRLRRAAGVQLLGYVDDVGPHCATASVAVAPLHSGGGTRLKVIEALARAVPLVSTSFGCEGLGLTHEHELLVADEPASFAASCARLIRDPDLAKRLTETGRARYEAHLTAERSSEAVTRVAAKALGVTASKLK
jgi:glycosyltransferase involved in cell wall biosynthesis